MEPIEPRTLIRAMAEIVSTDEETLLGGSRTQPLPMARFLLCATFCGAMMGMTTTEAGYWLGGRNHATVLHGMSVVALCRQKYGSPKERELIRRWDEYTNLLQRQRTGQQQTEQTEQTRIMSIMNYRGRKDSQSWEYGRQITVRDGVITINGRLVNPSTFGMGTGLLGRDTRTNKLREVFEGDIVRRKYISGNYVMRYDDRRAAFRLVPTIEGGPKDGQPAYMNASEQYTIHGNIHDDPVLGTAYSDAYVELQERKREQP